jgi:hypothetical protein
MNLHEVVTEAALQLEDAAATVVPGGVEWTRGGRPFAYVAANGGAEFLLDERVAAAAIRTPDTIASSRGTGWVRFSPAELDAHGIDRAAAWFQSAYRRQER